MLGSAHNLSLCFRRCARCWLDGRLHPPRSFSLYFACVVLHAARPQAHDVAHLERTIPIQQPACNLRKFIGRTPLATGLILRWLLAGGRASWTSHTSSISRAAGHREHQRCGEPPCTGQGLCRRRPYIQPDRAERAGDRCATALIFAHARCWIACAVLDCVGTARFWTGDDNSATAHQRLCVTRWPMLSELLRPNCHGLSNK